MGDPNSVDEWLAVARQHEAAAKAIADDKEAAAQALFHCGVGVECMIKALIMSVERLNAWPSKDSRPELYTHDLVRLMATAGVKVGSADPVAPAWLVMRRWERGQSYSPQRMPRKVARSFVDAAFGEEGVATWIRLTYLRTS